MNALDIVIVVVMIAGAVGGYRLGFVARVTSWVGLAAGIVVGAVLLPRLIRAMGADADRQRLLIVAAVVLIGCALAGQAAGLFVGSKVHLAFRSGVLRRTDNAVGSFAGVVGVVMAVWLLAPAVADVPDWPARQARTSRLVRTIDGFLPTPPDTTRALRRLVGERYPQVFEALRPAPRLGPPPAATGLDPSTAERVARSTVKVLGEACDRIQAGTGFVVGPSIVVTNAHVVAGESTTRLERSDGSTVIASVVMFDPRRDLALLRAPELHRPALPVGDTGPGGRGAVFGHPAGGALRLAPFRVGRRTVATGTDIYDRTRIERDVLFLSAALRPGDSGSALIDPDGRVVGVAFAIAPDKPDVAYALSTTELQESLRAPRFNRSDTGSCLA